MYCRDVIPALKNKINSLCSYKGNASTFYEIIKLDETCLVILGGPALIVLVTGAVARTNYTQQCL